MKAIIDKTEFPPEIGKRILKAKHGRCTIPALERQWDEIPDLTFAAIVKEISDTDHRRIAFKYLGLHRMLAELKPRLVCSETVTKTALWARPDGSLVRREYEDTYELFRVDWCELYIGVSTDNMGKEQPRELQQDRHFVKFRDTSTGREYVIWVDIREVLANNPEAIGEGQRIPMLKRKIEALVNPIMAIAWTIRTDIERGGIERIIRQGDCVLIRKLPGAGRLEKPRHLTEQEYRSLLGDES